MSRLDPILVPSIYEVIQGKSPSLFASRFLHPGKQVQDSSTYPKGLLRRLCVCVQVPAPAHSYYPNK